MYQQQTNASLRYLGNIMSLEDKVSCKVIKPILLTEKNGNH